MVEKSFKVSWLKKITKENKEIKPKKLQMT